MYNGNIVNRNAYLKWANTSTTSNGLLRARYIPGAVPFTTGMNLTDGALTLAIIASEGYWEIHPYTLANVPQTTFSAAPQYNLFLRANQYPSISSNYTNARIIKAMGSAPSTWATPLANWGTHENIVGTSSDFTVGRNSMLGFSYFAIAVPPLPQAVEFIGASHECSEDGTVNFEWSTATEHNSDHFIIETSEDGVNWETLAIQQAAGNSTLRSDYRMIVPAPLNDKYYIRLTELDMDGTESVLGVFAISCNDNNDMFTYPNPSDQQFMLSIHDPKLNGEITLTVTDALGAVIAVQSGLGIDGGVANVAIELPELTPGVYFISAARDEYIRTIRHVVK
jgi:hypothetical protein